jgi:hypothetical protein
VRYGIYRVCQKKMYTHFNRYLSVKVHTFLADPVYMSLGGKGLNDIGKLTQANVLLIYDVSFDFLLECVRKVAVHLGYST